MNEIPAETHAHTFTKPTEDFLRFNSHDVVYLTTTTTITIGIPSFALRFRVRQCVLTWA